MRKNLIFCSLLVTILLAGKTVLIGQDEATLSDDSRVCAQCHGNDYYTFNNEMTGTSERKRMNPFLIIDTTQYVKGVHRWFSCVDCHSYDYKTYPHAAELKLEPKFGCMDCHGGDETFAKYQFDEISVEVEKSVHQQSFSDKFDCMRCHDIHTYKVGVLDDSAKIRDIVVKNNEMCLSCHNNLSKYQILTPQDKPEILETHDWLPNQELHFLSVRCIECHTPVQDTLLVSHRILPKEQAVRNCAECHSTNSLLMSKLYKYAAQQTRSDRGFYNSLIMNEAYVIGANRNRYFNIISLIIFGMAIGGIGIHTAARIIKKK